MKEITCPYCEHNYDLNHDDGAFYSEDHRRKEECPKCKKTFMVTSSLSWYFEGEKADCLNGGEHDWKQIHGYPRENFVGREICRMCDKERKV